MRVFLFFVLILTITSCGVKGELENANNPNPELQHKFKPPRKKAFDGLLQKE